MLFFRLGNAFRFRVYHPFCESVGLPFGTRKPALNDLDKKLSVYLNFRNGFFVEAGGNDGISQSNTFFLEKGRKWRGILVEAIPELYSKCREIRKRSTVIHGGLVSRTFKKETLKMHYANLMSVAEGAMKDATLQKHVRGGLECQQIENSYEIDVPAVTFESILDEHNPPIIDFLSLDIEGFELEALNGWNFEKHRPRFILVEVRNLEEMDAFLLSNGYERVDQLSEHDYLYRDLSDKR